MKHAVIVIAIGVVVSVIAGAVLVWPKYQEFSDLRAQLIQKRTQLENQNKYIQQVQAMEEKIKEKQELADKVNSALPIGPDIPSLLGFLQKASTETGIILETVDWQELTSAQNEQQRIKEYTLNLGLSGSYFAFKNFLFALEKSARMIDVLQTTFSVSAGPDEPIDFEITAKVRSY